MKTKKEYAREWYLKNRERLRTKSRAYYIINREKRIAYTREYKKDHLSTKEQRSRYNKTYYYKHREKYLKGDNEAT